jgi:hypothetical protein
VRGRVAETYGSRFVLDDGSGRVLVELGRGGGTAPAARGQLITVQGWPGAGTINALYLVGQDGRAYAFGRRGGREHGWRGGAQRG